MVGHQRPNRPPGWTNMQRSFCREGQHIIPLVEFSGLPPGLIGAILEMVRFVDNFIQNCQAFYHTLLSAVLMAAVNPRETGP